MKSTNSGSHTSRTDIIVEKWILKSRYSSTWEFSIVSNFLESLLKVVFL